jgi:hypothetical protein
MTRFSRTTVLDWLHAQRGQQIRLGAKASALRLTGWCEGLEDLDACSTEFVSCRIRLSDPHAEATLTLHDTAVSLLVLLRTGPGGPIELSVPVTIPYGDLLLESGPEPKASAAAEDSPALVTPYRLLH